VKDIIMVSARARARARRISATNFDRLSGLDPTETSANRDVFESQQLERGRIERRLSKRGSRIAAAVVGVLVAAVVWLVVSLIGLGVSWALTMSDSATGSSTVGPYYTQSSRIGQGGAIEDCYQQLDEDGMAHGTCYRSVSQVPKPAWWVAARRAAAQQNAEGAATRPRPSWTREVTSVSLLKVFCTLACGLGAGVGLATAAGKRIAAANLMRQTTDINQHQGDQHIMIPDEVIDHADFDLFPDAGAHTDVAASAMISHIMLEAKGLGTVEMARRAPADVRTGDGDIEILAGEILTDDEDRPLTTRVPMIDEAFGDALFEASGMPDEKKLRKRFQVARRDYNPGDRNRNRLTGFATIGDLVRKDWNLPLYEVQRPAGAYVVDTAPVNTMVLAITRAGKGQTYIEPMIDMWSRERRPSNMVINDPKGELLVKFFVPLVRRGYSPVQFNLINSMKTDIYNPLGLAADAAREGDQTKCAQYVENIAMVFFPTDTGDDPMWNNAANNAFKRAAYGLIDYYLEEEAELRDIAARTDMDPEILEHKLDDMWGHVTLYNVYQFFVQLSSKKRKSPKDPAQGAWEGPAGPDQGRRDDRGQRAHHPQGAGAGRAAGVPVERQRGDRPAEPVLLGFRGAAAQRHAHPGRQRQQLPEGDGRCREDAGQRLRHRHHPDELLHRSHHLDAHQRQAEPEHRSRRAELPPSVRGAAGGRLRQGPSPGRCGGELEGLRRRQVHRRPGTRLRAHRHHQPRGLGPLLLQGGLPP
jgi:hypothetical protein